MKKLYKDIKRTSFLFVMTFILTSNMAMSKDSPELRVDYIVGKAFLRAPDGNTTLLKKGDHVYHLSEINTSEGSLVGLSNFYDQEFSLAGSGYVKIFRNILELRAGYLWVESVNIKNEKYQVETPNAKLTYEKGIAIISYDQYSQKTQILTTQGTFNFMNIFEDHLKIDVSIGEFSFISKDYENGMPRRPTPAGQSTFLKITGLFNDRPTNSKFTDVDTSYQLVEKSQDSLLGRLPSSITKSKKVGQIIYAQTKKLVYGFKEKDLMSFNQRKIASMSKAIKPKKRKKFKASYEQASKVKVRIFGALPTVKKVKMVNKMPKKKVYKKRVPASVSKLNNNVIIKKTSFESSLTKEYKNQLRHSKQLNSLINDLNAYDQDYKQSY